MALLRLPRADGFSQRHFGNPGVSRYLKSLDKGYNYWRSPVTVSAIRDDLHSFHNPYVGSPPPALKVAIGHAYRAFRLPEPVKMLHLNEVFQYGLNIWPNSPGLPWKSLGFNSKAEVRDNFRARNSIKWFIHRIKNGESVSAPDSCAFVRSHIAVPPESKVRAVWGYPMSMTMGEAVFAVPLIEAYQTVGNPIAYGYETAVGGTRRLVAQFAKHGGIYTAIDFKSFDKTVPNFLIDAAFEILSANIDFCHYRGRGVADARKTIRLFEYIQTYFKRTPIRLCNGERYKKQSGVASGSYFTQLIDSIVNYILVVWICLEITGHPPVDCKVLGDDSIFATRQSINLDDVSDLVKQIGMEINVAKSVTSRHLGNLTFLGYQLNDGVPTKPHDKWMAALLYPERPDRRWDDCASRAVGLCYANLGVDSVFDQLCRRIIALQPFTLTFSRSFAKMLWIAGWKNVSPTPPEPLEFLRRMSIW